MIESYTELQSDHVAGRWVIITRYESKQWNVIVEPDFVDEVVVVITAYPLESP
jgi:hypothetical protein